jgi:50S ribosomal subunit-associated GTPase HflX
VAEKFIRDLPPVLVVCRHSLLEEIRRLDRTGAALVDP